MEKTQKEKRLEVIDMLLTRIARTGQSCGSEPPAFTPDGAVLFFREEMGLEFTAEEVEAAVDRLRARNNATKLSKGRGLYRISRYPSHLPLPLFHSFGLRRLRTQGE